MIEQKEKLRRKLKAARLAMNPEEAAVKSKVIADKLLAEVDWASVGRMHIYSSKQIWKEADTKDILETIRAKWPEISIDTSESKLNEPIPSAQFDLIIVPVLGFDDQNYRLGLGAGWYDRFLAGQPKAQTIGLAYAAARVDALPHEPHDIPLRSIITEL